MIQNYPFITCYIQFLQIFMIYSDHGLTTGSFDPSNMGYHGVTTFLAAGYPKGIWKPAFLLFATINKNFCKYLCRKFSSNDEQQELTDQFASQPIRFFKETRYIYVTTLFRLRIQTKDFLNFSSHSQHQWSFVVFVLACSMDVISFLLCVCDG